MNAIRTHTGRGGFLIKMKYFILIRYNCVHATFKVLNMFLVYRISYDQNEIYTKRLGVIFYFKGTSKTCNWAVLTLPSLTFFGYK